MSVRCFWVEPAPIDNIRLRRYRSGSEERCPGQDGDYSYHHAVSEVIDRVAPVIRQTSHGQVRATAADYPQPAPSDPRWPRVCEHCAYEFTGEDAFQIFADDLYRGEDGHAWPLRELPPGAMYDAWWFPSKGDDGRSLCVILPNGRAWLVDSHASNCTLPEENKHRCWVRHGEPPEVTVDKNGNTCQAGAGSILSGDWHGFLREGHLVT